MDIPSGADGGDNTHNNKALDIAGVNRHISNIGDGALLTT